MSASTLSVSELARRRREGWQPQLIDVRSPGEFSAGHVPGAINNPMEQMEARMADINPAAPLILICQSGKRASITAGALEGRCTDLQVLEGGTANWARQGEALVTVSAARWALERQVRIISGLIVLAGVALAFLVDARWSLLSGAVGLGLTVSSLLNICPTASLLARMPWNRVRPAPRG